MALQDWAALAEIAGLALVVITLAFLGVQIRQNTRALRADIRLGYSAHLRDTHLNLARDPDLGQIVMGAMRDLDSLSPVDRMRWYWWLQSIMHGLEGYFPEQQDARLGADWHRAFDNVVGGMVTYPSIRKWWDEDADTRFTHPFVEYANKFKDTDPTWRWLDKHR